MVELDARCRQLAIRPRDLRQVYLSIGPGSFTGLRVGVAIAKMLAQAAGAKVVAVPTLRVLACNTPLPYSRVVTCLNLKKETVYAGLFRREADAWRPDDAPSLRTMNELLQAAPRPVAILGDPLPPLPQDGATLEGVTVLPASFAMAHAEAVWRIGREMAGAGQFTDPWQLVPLYVRPPEAVELWNKRHGPEMVKT
jgi:tRNA threonylcarbamoyladenosine biosynthesis protein TsaB